MKRIPKVAYTLEFKLEALRRVRGGEPVRKVGREIGVPEQSIRTWVKAKAEGKLGTVEKGKPITPEQMVEQCLHAHSPGSGPAARLGAVAFIHRFGSALNAHLHFHSTT